MAKEKIDTCWRWAKHYAENKRYSLGVTLSCDASFDRHIANIVKRPKSLTSLIRPHLEYCSQLWNPFHLQNILLLENVQRCFTEWIPNLKDLHYWQRLGKLELYSLERRRERYLIIHTWKILNGKVININTPDGDGIKYKPSTLNSRLGRMCHIPPLTRSSTAVKTLKDNSFIIHGPRLFNCINVKKHSKLWVHRDRSV